VDHWVVLEVANSAGMHGIIYSNPNATIVLKKIYIYLLCVSPAEFIVKGKVMAVSIVRLSIKLLFDYTQLTILHPFPNFFS